MGRDDMVNKRVTFQEGVHSGSLRRSHWPSKARLEAQPGCAPLPPRPTGSRYPLRDGRLAAAIASRDCYVAPPWYPSAPRAGAPPPGRPVRDRKFRGRIRSPFDVYTALTAERRMTTPGGFAFPVQSRRGDAMGPEFSVCRLRTALVELGQPRTPKRHARL